MKKPEPGFIMRKVLEESEDERWTYEQISTPVVSNRDYTMHSKRSRDAQTGVCQVFFETRNQDGPPPASWLRAHSYVFAARFPSSPTVSSKKWRELGHLYDFQRARRQSSPAWMARGGQKKSALQFMKTILARECPVYNSRTVTSAPRIGTRHAPSITLEAARGCARGHHTRNASRSVRPCSDSCALFTLRSSARKRTMRPRPSSACLITLTMTRASSQRTSACAAAKAARSALGNQSACSVRRCSATVLSSYVPALIA